MAVLLFLAILITPGAGILVVRFFDQKERDSNRKTYQLHFPRDLEGESVTAWIRSISGTLKRSHVRLTGAPTIALEMWASNRGIIHRLKVPWQYEESIIPQLRSRGIRVIPEDEFPKFKWTHAVELRMTHSSRQLRIEDVGELSLTLLNSVQTLEEDDTILVQWVITPAQPKALPVHHAKTNQLHPGMFLNGTEATRDEIMDRREKLSQPNVHAVLRLASHAKTHEHAKHLTYRVWEALASAHSHPAKFVKRLIPQETVQNRIDLASGSVNFPILLSAPELAALIAWPIGNPHVSGLPPYMARQLPAGEMVPREGRIIGLNNFPGKERPVAVSYLDARRHMHVVGKTGVGKTVFLANCMKQDMENESRYGVVLIESKGDLFRAALDYVPPNRINDVIVFDVNDVKNPVGFNILDQANPLQVIDEVLEIFENLEKDTLGTWMRDVLYHGLRTIATDLRLSVIDLGTLLRPQTTQEEDWANSVIRNVKDIEIRLFWQRYQQLSRPEREKFIRPVIGRIWQLSARPEVKYTIGQSKSSFQMTDVVKDNKILLVNLQNLPPTTASLVGTLLMNSLWTAVKTTPDRTTLLYLDEFEDFIKIPVSAEDMLVKARGFGLGITLAHQDLDQLVPKSVERAVMANTRTKVIFEVGNDDARAMAKEFGYSVDEHDFMAIGQYEAIARVSTGSGMSAPLTLSMYPPAKGYNKASQVLYVSRQEYGRKASDVEAEITQRRTPEAAPKSKRPSIGSANVSPTDSQRGISGNQDRPLQ